VWAWRGGRVRFLRDHIELMITVLPFEKKIYESAGVPVEYVGHPLVEIVRDELSRQPALERGGEMRVGIMPGSREVEVQRHLPILLEALRQVGARRRIEALLIRAPSLPLPAGLDPGIRCVSENRYAAMKSCDFLLVASGTSTLECAILNAPFVIVYRVSSLSWQLGKALVRIPYYGLVNWIAGRKVIPEFIQDRMNAETLAAETLKYLNDARLGENMRAELSTIVDLLGPPGALDRAANAIASRL
jgi:lipid-A-disaccharide synthase